ncbi:Ger(x)C family spore germination C-terminal domain-containing protein [Brevibacillus humidisoli]|uniref:Ger(x)C family spore germination C-terminal domain-containing protein n=1 Tax=Brevibacillus humidisoli TaxID=2895522 RepID=UPI001E3A5CFC|nr:Ger(x)C family spore germination C-terminal domain-containing protein [Brevibacillus humidisoli]UFJ40827.1 Ger(x)C family spore germination C-terminal domain-containing protein [Brevibacillus humidisoli]
MAEQIRQDCDRLIKKIQQHQIDPIGLGVYAQAWQYSHWKEAADDWGKALSKAKIRIQPVVHIRGFGVSM